MLWLRVFSVLKLPGLVRRLLTPERQERAVPEPPAPPAPPALYFLFVGEAGSCLGGMQDYYGAYDDLPAALHAVPDGVDWAEVAAIEGRSLGVVTSGERDGYRWRWSPLLDARHTRHEGAIGIPFGTQAA